MIQSLLSRKGVMDCIRKWFTAKEAAEYMGMHPETVYRFLQRKELRSVKAGRTYRVKSCLLYTSDAADDTASV